MLGRFWKVYAIREGLGMGDGSVWKAGDVGEG